MSKHSDILMIGGPAHGHMINAEHPVKSSYQVGDSTYVTTAWENPDTQERYWIATNDPDVTDEQIVDAIADTNFQPAWDLKP